MGVEVSQSVAERTPIEAVRARPFTVPTDRQEADGALEPDPHAPGHGLSLREDEAERFEL